VTHSPAEIEQAFAAALLDPELPVPAGVLGRAAAAPHRFAIYRNNFVAGLTQALRHRFPVSERLVGEDFFRAMARDYIAGHRPRSPLLMTYGDDFPGRAAKHTRRNRQFRVKQQPSSKDSRRRAICPISPMSRDSKWRGAKPITPRKPSRWNLTP
jgi:hypothetical protein